MLSLYNYNFPDDQVLLVVRKVRVRAFQPLDQAEHHSVRRQGHSGQEKRKGEKIWAQRCLLSLELE